MNKTMTMREKRRALKKLLSARRQPQSPVSFGQERLWFIDQLTPGSPAYNLRLAIRLRGTLDVDALEQSINQIVARHDVLRARFVVADNRPKQIIAPQLTLPMPMVSAENEADIERLADQEAQRPFDLATGPLIRSQLLIKHPTEHVLLITMHHTVSDGWSLGIFMQELAALYRANSGGTATNLSALPLQYPQFAQWQREQFANSLMEKQLAYWREKLAGHQPSLDLPTDRPRPPVQTFSGDRHHFTIDAAMTQALRTLQTGGITEFMVLLAAFKVLLYRYSGQSDILIGSPIAGRNRADLETLIGLFINTLVLRSTLADEMTFSDLLAQVMQTAQDAYAHQDVPFEKLVEAVQPVRDPSRNPLFQVLFILQNAPQGSHQLPDLELSLMRPKKGTAQFDLSLTLWQEGDALAGYLEYNSDLYDAQTVARMATHYQTLLGEVGRDAGQSISQIPILKPSERDQILHEWNATARDYDLTQLLADRFEAQVAQSPDRRAVSCDGQTLTYAELNARANAIAQCLQAHGIGADDLVGLAAERSLEMLIGLLGILKAGAAYVPIDPDYPAERVQYMIDTAELTTLVTQSALQDRYQGDLNFVLLDTLTDGDPANPTRTTQPTDRAYIIFTSGSTGKPKGVQIEQRSIINFLLSMAETPGISADDTLLAITTISFDIATLELYLPLLVGAHVVIATSSETRDSYRLADMLVEHDATVMQATPATWRMLLAADWQGHAPLKLLSGGEALPQDLATQLLRCGRELWNVYGPTEATVWATAHRVSADDVRDSSQPVTIGKPIANTSCYILDRHFAPVPIGVIGDLYIGGVQVARGYLQRPELTAERFVENPHPSLRDTFSLREKESRHESLAAPVQITSVIGKDDYVEKEPHHESSASPLPEGEGSGVRVRSEGEGEERNTLVYKTGDLARYRPDGTIEFLGREDFQVKIRGFRIELGEIEAQLVQHNEVREAVVTARRGLSGEDELIAYIIPIGTVDAQRLREFLGGFLPNYMIPGRYVSLEAFPLTPNGKVNRRALPEPDEQPIERAEFAPPATPTEKQVAAIWQEILNLEQIGRHDNFFELGGESILGIQVIGQLRKIGLQAAPEQLFQFQTVAQLAAALAPQQGDSARPLTPQQTVALSQQHRLTIRYHEPLDVARLREALGAVVEQHTALQMELVDDEAEPRQTLAQDVAICVCGVGEACANPDATLRVNLTADDCMELIVAAWQVDAAALPIVVADLFAAYEALTAIKPTAQFASWVRRLDSAENHPLPTTLPAVATSSPNGQRSRVQRTLSTDDTARLHQIPAAYNVEPDEVLFAALAQTLDAPILCTSFQRHLRFHDFDATRTVGNLRTELPLSINTNGDAADVIANAKQAIRAAQRWSFAYAAQRHQAAALPPRHNAVFTYRPPIEAENVTVLSADLHKPEYALHITAQELAGELQLTATALGHDSAELAQTLDTLIDHLHTLIDHCLASDDANYDPSDFPDANLDADELGAFLSQFGD